MALFSYPFIIKKSLLIYMHLDEWTWFNVAYDITPTIREL